MTQITVVAHQHGLMSRTDTLYSIKLISPGSAVPVGFTESLTRLAEPSNANGDLLVGEN